MLKFQNEKSPWVMTEGDFWKWDSTEKMTLRPLFTASTVRSNPVNSTIGEGFKKINESKNPGKRKNSGVKFIADLW